MFRRPGSREIRDFQAWARERAAVFDPLDGRDADIEKLSFLDGPLRGKQVVYLGEEDHWIHEKSDYRLTMLRYLISRGWRYIGEELGWSDGIRIDGYLATGDESYLEKIAAYGYEGAVRTDREDKATGILGSAREAYPVAAFKAEQLRLVRALREINGSREAGADRVHYWGFDIDTVTGGGYEDAEALLRPFERELPVHAVLASLERVRGETIEEEIRRLNGVMEAMGRAAPRLRELLGAQRYRILQENILTLRDSLEFNRIANPARDYGRLNAAMAMRENAMFRHVRSFLSQMKAEDKAVLMGHNRHLAKDPGGIKHAGAAPPGGGRVPSLGARIDRLLPGRVFSVWEIHDHGESSQPYADLDSVYTSRPRCLNAVLAEVGPNFCLQTAGAPLLERELDIVGIYNQVYRTAIARQADAVFFIAEVGPLRADAG